MKKTIFTSLAILVLALSAFAQKGKATKTDATKGVRTAFETLIDGIKKADVEKVMSVYDKSAKILFFNNNGSATIGWDEMKKVRENIYAKTKNVTIDVTGLRIEMLGKDAAFVTCKWKQTQDYDDKPETAAGRMTLVFRLIGKDWKVVHLHTSPDTTRPDRTYLDSERDIKSN
jgi:ketosteroid isomerase-like protein